jgi:hypothetical protein
MEDVMDRIEKLDTTNSHRTGRGNVADRIDGPKAPTYSQNQSFSEGTAYRVDECPAVKSAQIGDGTGSGTTAD